jgi:hypothetical protein
MLSTQDQADRDSKKIDDQKQLFNVISDLKDFIKSEPEDSLSEYAKEWVEILEFYKNHSVHYVNPK